MIFFFLEGCNRFLCVHSWKLVDQIFVPVLSRYTGLFLPTFHSSGIFGLILLISNASKITFIQGNVSSSDT